MLRYREFRLQILNGPSGGYTVQAFSPRGEGRAPFVVPSRLGELDILKVAIGTASTVGRHLIAEAKGEPELSSEAFGELLFEALFPSEILRLYERSLDLLGANPDAGLRIELVIDPRDAGVAAFQAFPWELMRQPGTPEFLALSRRRPFVRSLAVPRAVYAPQRVKPIRILALASSPRDENLGYLDLARELRNLEEAVGTTDKLEIVRPEAPTFAALRQACREQKCQVLHFMGHGESGEGDAEGVLFFEAEDGSPDPIRGVDVVNKLADFPTLRLVVLNSCASAASPDMAWSNPMASVASSLVLGGMPAVVAMQFPISDQAAITFSRAFYQYLAAGETVDAAVAEGRQAVHSENPAAFEWATPVLFLRGQDASPELVIRGKWVRWSGAVLLGLLLIAGAGLAGRTWWTERLVAQGVAFFEYGRWAEAREQFQAALKLAPGSAEVLSNLAAIEERMGDLGAAEEHYRKAVEERPESAEHLFNLGFFLNGRGRYEEAYPFLVQAAEIEPERVDAYGELAQAAVRLEMPGRARIALSVGLRIDPDRPALHRLLGELELKSGHPRAAVSHLKEAQRLYPIGELRRVETTWLLAQAYERLGDVAAACRVLHELRYLDEAGITPWAPEARIGSERLRCAS